MKDGEDGEGGEDGNRVKVGRKVLDAVVLLLALSACSGVPPMRHHIEAGQEPFVVFVADAPDGRGDLYAMTPVGSDVVQLTFSLPAEWSPSLSPNGTVVAFIRSREESDTTNAKVWLLNLLNGAERELVLPDSSGAPVRVAFIDDGRKLLVQTTVKMFKVMAPPARPEAEEVAMDPEAFAIRVGTPSFARVAQCAESKELCVVPDSGTPAPLAEGARDAARWGDDSLSYVQGDELVIRPLGPGHPRVVRWRSSLRNPRSITVFEGPERSPERSGGGRELDNE